MHILDLPTEITRLIVQSYYEPWSISICKLSVNKDASWRFEAGGLPDLNLQLTCHALQEMAKEAERNSFTGKMFIEEETSAMSLVYEAFIEAAQTNTRLNWVRQHVKSARFRNPTNNPAVWRFVHSLYTPELPKLQRIELDCRYAYHFAVHNVVNAADFISGADGRLEKLLDYRHSFFLVCERFLLHSVRRGLAIRVIRDMGVREGIDRCRAMVRVVAPSNWAVLLMFAAKVVAINYVADDGGQLMLDWRSLESNSTVIERWPDKIREALATLEI